jgi:hypothetical protein
LRERNDKKILILASHYLVSIYQVYVVEKAATAKDECSH